MKPLVFKKDILPFITATLGEFFALYFWLKFMDQDKWLPANVLLWAGFMVERVSVFLWLRNVYRAQDGMTSEATPVWQAAIGLILITLSEIVIWILWLWLADDVSIGLAAGVLLILMLGEHSLEMSLVKKTKPLTYVTHGKTIFYTVIEAGGAVAWLYLVRHEEPIWGALVLLVALSIEHVLQGSQLKPESRVDDGTTASLA